MVNHRIPGAERLRTVGSAVVRGVSLAAVVGLVLGGCSALSGSGTTPRSLTDASSPANLVKYFAQHVSWTSCGTATQCATITAPLDWAHPDSGTITLALARLPAPAAARQGSVLLNPGGPGASGVDYLVAGGNYVATPMLQKNFDIVSWDPRGVGGSSRVTCLSDAEKDSFLYRTWNAAYGTDAWVAELGAAEKGFVAACVAGTGPLLQFVDSVSTAHDMDLIRVLLGEKTLNYLGYSYGTNFGVDYAQLFPERVGRFVLDGATDPTLAARDWITAQMAGFDSAMTAFIANCVRNADCPLGPSVADADTALAALTSTIDARELPSGDGRVFDEATLGTAIADALYSESLWPSLRAMFADLQGADARSAFALADEYNGRTKGGYDDNSFEVYTATLCLDSNFGTDAGTTATGIRGIRLAAPLVGEIISYDDYAHLDVACGLWPYPPTPKPADFSARGAALIMVVGTTNDPATPYRGAQALASQLSSGFLVTRNGEGHTAYAGGNACIDTTVDDYFVGGVVPTTDPNC